MTDGRTLQQIDLDALMDEVLLLRATASEQSQFAGVSDLSPGLANLGHYLALRHRDLRGVQRRLMALGLSSLGRMESRVLPTLDAVLCALAALGGRFSPYAAPGADAFFAGEARLTDATDMLFGLPAAHRRGRIMVTLPGEAANDADFILDLAQSGMDCARINCAHDDVDHWRKMTAHVHAAGRAVGRDIRVLMDIAGPKIRTGDVETLRKGRLEVGDRIRLVADGKPRPDEDVPFSALVSLPEIVTRLSVGDRVRYDDGKLEGVVESTAGREAVLRVTHTKAGGAKLKPEKGLNLPDTELDLSPLTVKDNDDLVAVLECADMLGYSFVSRPEDIDLLDEALARHGERQRPLGLIAKIEQPRAVRNLPVLIERATRGGRPFGVMIARGDLAAEIGFERVAEMQEEILWICEAAGVPAIWATQVLEDLVKDGLPSRGEMTDAAMAARAECVMLNKGPAVTEAVALLDRLLERMDGHIFKKTPTLRALQSW